MKMTTQERILEQAGNWIRREGYQHLPLRKLTAELDFTTGAFYKVFKNKDELFYQLCIRESQKQLERLQEGFLKDIQNPLDGIWAIGRFILAEYQTDPKMMDFLLFNPVSSAAFQRGEVLPVGQQTKIYLTELGIEDLSEIERLLLKLNAFILGYGILIAQGMSVYDEEFYQSAFEDLLGRWIEA